MMLEESGFIRNGDYLESKFPLPPYSVSGRRSRFLNERAVQSINRIGDIFCPGEKELPRFSELGCVEHIDRLAAEMSENDIKDLGFLLSILSFFPKPILIYFLKFLEFSPRLPTLGFGIFRFMRLGIKGLIVSLYYSGFCGRNYRGLTPHQVLGFKMRVYIEDLDPAPKKSLHPE